MLGFGRGIAKHRKLVMLIGLLLLIPSIYGYLHTRVNYDILYYLPDSLETMQGQDILLKDFGKGAYGIFIAKGMEDSDAAKLQKQIEEVDHVAQVLSFSSVSNGILPEEILPDEIYEKIHAEDSSLMAIFFDEGTSAESTMAAIEEIRDLAGDQCFLSSMSALVTDTKNLVDEQLFWYVLIAVILSALVLTLTMDSFMAPVLFLLTIGIAIVYNLGSNMIQGEISFITMSLAAVLQLAVTMDYSIFLWNSYKEEQKEIAEKEEAMAHAISKTIVSVAGSSLTTVAGFIALCFMSFTLGMDMGVVMAKGVVMGVICCVTLLPCFILSCDKLIAKFSHKPLNVKGTHLADFVLRYHKIILVVFMLLWIPAIYGYNNLNVYYKLDASLPDYLPSIQANKELADNYNMSSIEMILMSDETSTKTVKAMVNELKEVDGVGFVLGTDSLVPTNVPQEFLPSDLASDLEAGGWKLLMLSSDYEVASDEANAQCTVINDIIKRYDANAMLIGEAPCTKDLITMTAHDFKVVSAISIAAIFILILLVLRSVSLPVILVLVIELAIYINLALSFYIGTVESFISSIVIGTIQLGATVDYAILMTNRYQVERGNGLDKFEATRVALINSMPSVITSALGFFAATIGVGLYSDVDLISSICVLLARGALISMTLVLLLLPSLYLVFDGLIQKTSFRKK